MWAEILVFDGYSAVLFESPDALLGHSGEAPDVTIVDAWTARSSESSLLARLSRDHVIVTSTTRVLALSWHRLGAARVYLKPISIEQIRADLRDLAECPGPASRTVRCQPGSADDFVETHKGGR